MKFWSSQSTMYIFYANQSGKSAPNWFPGLALAMDPHGQLIGEHLPTEGMLVTETSKQALAEARDSKADKSPRSATE